MEAITDPLVIVIMGSADQKFQAQQAKSPDVAFEKTNGLPIDLMTGIFFGKSSGALYVSHCQE